MITYKDLKKGQVYKFKKEGKVANNGDVTFKIHEVGFNDGDATECRFLGGDFVGYYRVNSKYRVDLKYINEKFKLVSLR